MDEQPSEFERDGQSGCGTIREMPAELRPREAFLKNGAKKLAIDQLLAIILRSGLPGTNVSDLARQLLKRFDGLAGLARAEYGDILAKKIPGLGKVKAMELAAALELGSRVAQELSAGQTAPSLSSPRDIYQLLYYQTLQDKQEHFWSLLLDVKNRMIVPPEAVSTGTLDFALVHPRDVFMKAVRFGAARIILAHNHPSGDPQPSRQDIELTQRMVSCGELMGIPVIDHIVIGRKTANSRGYVSLREEGLVTFKS